MCTINERTNQYKCSMGMKVKFQMLSLQASWLLDLWVLVPVSYGRCLFDCMMRRHIIPFDSHKAQVNQCDARPDQHKLLRTPSRVSWPNGLHHPLNVSFNTPHGFTLNSTAPREFYGGRTDGTAGGLGFPLKACSSTSNTNIPSGLPGWPL